jgi:O-antigen/teichoic acid export membrane protein
LLGVYGLLLLTTSLGVDYAFRGMERMGVVAISLVIRTIVYVVGVTISEIGPGRLEVVPIWLVFGEAVGILFSWTMLVRGYGWPRMRWGRWRFSRVFAARCRSIYLMQGSQSILASLDMIIVGFTSTWVEVGRYGAAHRMVSIGLAVGMMVPQVVFPSLARSWRMGSGEARGILDGVVRLVVMASVPLVVGVLVFGGPVVGLIFGGEFRGTGRYLSMGIARAPIFVMAYLYMTTLVALNRESRGVWIQVAAAISAVVLVCMGRWLMGPEGAILGMLATGVGVWVAGYWSLRELGRAPGWHHHVWRPIVAGFLMWVVGVRSEGMGLALGMLLSVVCYVVVLVGLGGIGLGELLAIWPWAGRGCGRVKVGGLGGGDSERDSVLNYEDARI